MNEIFKACRFKIRDIANLSTKADLQPIADLLSPISIYTKWTQRRAREKCNGSLGKQWPGFFAQRFLQSERALRPLFASGENMGYVGDTCLRCGVSQEAYLVTACPRQICHGPLLFALRVYLDPDAQAILPGTRCSTVLQLDFNSLSTKMRHRFGWYSQWKKPRLNRSRRSCLAVDRRFEHRFNKIFAICKLSFVCFNEQVIFFFSRNYFIVWL